jgi:hypothetical protein
MMKFPPTDCFYQRGKLWGLTLWGLIEAGQKAGLKENDKVARVRGQIGNGLISEKYSETLAKQGPGIR